MCVCVRARARVRACVRACDRESETDRPAEIRESVRASACVLVSLRAFSWAYGRPQTTQAMGITILLHKLSFVVYWRFGLLSLFRSPKSKSPVNDKGQQIEQR